MSWHNEFFFCDGEIDDISISRHRSELFYYDRLKGIYIMSKYTLDVNNYSTEDVESALSLHSLEVKFEDGNDQHIYTILLNNIGVYVKKHITSIKDKYENELQGLMQEYHSETTSDERKAEITFIKRCIEYGNKFKKNRNFIYKFDDQLERIVAQLFQSYRLNKMSWINRSKNYYIKNKLTRYFSYIFNCEALCLTLDVLENLGYIDGIGYTKGTKYNTGKSSRYMPSGICKIFDRIKGKVKFISQEYKDVVILKDDITKTERIKTKLGGYIYVEKTIKKLVNYEDNDFTNRRRNFIHKINKFYGTKKIEVSTRNVLLKKSFIPILYNWIDSDRIFIKRLTIEGNNNEDYITYINKLKSEGYNIKMCNGCEVDDKCMYKYILSKKMPILKDLDYYSVNNDYVFVKDIQFEVLDKSIRSVFNRGSFNQGGRFYGAIWTELPKVLRKAVLIDGSRVKSGDYKAHHIRLAYHVDYVECPFDDPYDIAGTDRDEMKLASLVSINAPDLDSAVFATVKKINKKLSKNISEDNAECLLMKLVEKHPVLMDRVASDYGVSLQFYDSEIMMDALETLMDLRICGLGVHDEIIVPVSEIDKAVEVMIDAYKNQSFTHGFAPTVTVDKDEIDVPYLGTECDLAEFAISDDGNMKEAA